MCFRSGMFADRKQRQLEERTKLRLDRAQRIGRGDDDSGKVRVEFVGERQRLEPQHRRQHDLEPPLAQRAGGRLIVGMRAGDENGHFQLRRVIARRLLRGYLRNDRFNARASIG